MVYLLLLKVEDIWKDKRKDRLAIAPK